MLGLRLHSWFKKRHKFAMECGLSSESVSAELRVSAHSDVGRVRVTNEDAVGFHRPVSLDDYKIQGALALVADGMGGVNGGEMASRMICDSVPQIYFGSRKKPPEALREALELVNRTIYRQGRRHRDLNGMGATCIALAIRPPYAWAAWVGDSRLYLLRGGQIFQMTEDHSVVNEMVRRGLLNREEASRHSERNLVTRSLGSHPDVEVDVWTQAFPIRIGDRFLLCSDGLHDLVSNAEILEIASTKTVDKACIGLIEAANMHGGHDNVSAVLLEAVNDQGNPVRETPQTREFLGAQS